MVVMQGLKCIWNSLFLTLFFFQAHSQQLISEIKFEGISRTKEAYLANFITVSMGDSVQPKVLEADRQRLANLEVLADVILIINHVKKGTEIVFECEELFTLLPILNFGSLTNNYWLQIGASEANLFGYGHKLYAYYQFYDRSSAAAHLNLNRIKGSRWGANINYIRWGTVEPLFFNAGRVLYDYDHTNYGIDIIYNLNSHNKLLFGFAYFTERYLATTTLVEGAPRTANKTKALYKLIYSFNKVNSYYYFLEGFANDLVTEHVQSLDGEQPFFIAYNDFKYYIRLKERTNLAFRLRIGLSSNAANPFAPFVLDSYLNIRGVGNKVDRGTGTLVLNAEYRYGLLDYEKLALQSVAFLDLGTWRTPGGTVDDFYMKKNQQYYGGLGLRIIHKQIYNAILRIDYGINLNNGKQSSLVIGIGQYF